MMMTTDNSTTHRHRRGISWMMVTLVSDVDTIAGRSLALLLQLQSSSLLREQLSLAVVILCILIDPQSSVVSVVDDGR